MKKQIIKSAILGVIAATGLNVASAIDTNAATVPLSTPETVKICKTITNAYDATTATFNYTFTAATTGVTGLPTNAKIAFSGASYNSSHQASKCADIDVSGITFSDSTPKQIAVSVKETAVSGYSADTTTYTLLLDLRNTVDANNNVTGQVATGYLQNASGAKVTQLDFTSAKQYSAKNILITKTVRGAAADSNKYFKFTVNVSGSGSYTVNGAASGSGSATSCTAGSNCVVYLKSGDQVRIGYTGTASQIPVGATYTVTEDTYSDYTTTVAVGTSAATTARATGQQTVMPTDAANAVAYVNTKTSSTPTGIFLNIWPYILLGVISVGAMIYTKKASTEKK